MESFSGTMKDPPHAPVSVTPNSLKTGKPILDLDNVGFIRQGKSDRGHEIHSVLMEWRGLYNWALNLYGKPLKSPQALSLRDPQFSVIAIEHCSWSACISNPIPCFAVIRSNLFFILRERNGVNFPFRRMFHGKALYHHTPRAAGRTFALLFWKLIAA